MVLALNLRGFVASCEIILAHEGTKAQRRGGSAADVLRRLGHDIQPGGGIDGMSRNKILKITLLTFGFTIAATLFYAWAWWIVMSSPHQGPPKYGVAEFTWLGGCALTILIYLVLLLRIMRKKN
jgi:hypothetical protein